MGKGRRPLCSFARYALCYTLTGSLEWVGRLLAPEQISGFDLRFMRRARGKSEHRRATNWLTARRGDPTTSATENRPADGPAITAKAGNADHR